MAVTKDQLTARKRGSGGTAVRYIGVERRFLFKGRQYVVKDLFDRKSFNEPYAVGIGPDDQGWALAVSLSEIEIV